MKYEVQGSDVIFDGKSVHLEHEVKKVIEYDGLLIVLLSSKGMNDEDARRNIWAISDNGEVVWRIEPVKYLDDDMPHLKQSFREKIPVPYVGLRLAEDGIRATSQNDGIYLIDYKTGKRLKMVGQTH